MLPAEAYTSEEVLAWERRHLFAGAGPASAGSTTCSRPRAALTQRAVVVGDVSCLLVARRRRRRCGCSRTPAGTAATSCCPEGGTSTKRAASLPLPRLDLRPVRAAEGRARLPRGRALRRRGPRPGRAAARRSGTAGCSAHALHPLGAPEVPPFERYVGELARLLAPYDIGALVVADRHSYEVAANWKVIAENYHECYHCPLIHPELCQVTPPDSGDNYDLPGAWIGGGDGPARRDGARCRWTARWRRRRCPGSNPTAVEYLHLLPNLLVSAHPDYVMTHRMVPLAPGRTWVECSWLTLPDADGTRPARRGAVEFWDITNRQDWAACESVQRGLAVAALPARAVRAERGRGGAAGLDDRRGVPLGRAVRVSRRVGRAGRDRCWSPRSRSRRRLRRPRRRRRAGRPRPRVTLTPCKVLPHARCGRSSGRGSRATRPPAP